MNCVTNQPINFEQIKVVMLKGERPNVLSSCYQAVIDLFDDIAFRENPYQYVIESLLDHYFYHLPIITFSLPQLIGNLPDFDANTPVSLLEQIAVKRFQGKPQYEQIMDIFKRSISQKEFVMRFEYEKRHVNQNEFAVVLQRLYTSAANLQIFSLTQQEIDDILGDDILE